MQFIQENNLPIFTILGIITFALSTYLGVLYVKVRNNKNAMILKAQIQERKAAKESAKRELFLKDSIITICRATVQKQCELSEACIRIKKLLENYPEIAKEAEFSVIQDMYNEIEKFPYLDARTELTKQEKFSQDNERFKIEENYSHKMHNSLNLLLQRFESLS